jgi:hypothetical protein
MKSWKLIRGLVRSLPARWAEQADRSRIGKRIGATSGGAASSEKYVQELRRAPKKGPFMSRLAKRMLPLLALCSLLTAQARADHFIVGFDFGASSISLLGGIVQIPPDGSITSSSGELVVSAVGLATPIANAPVALRNFSATATLNALTFGNTISGNIVLNQVDGGVPGALTAGLANALFAGPMQVSQNGVMNCTGPSCAVLGLPTTLSGIELVALGNLPIANLAVIGNALIDGTFAITIGGFTGQLHLVGNEVSRVFVPEPSSAGLLGLGLALLAGWRVRKVLQAR